MNRQEAEALLPWFVAGTLDPEEAEAVQAFIDSGEISQDELTELAVLAETVTERSATEPAYDPAIVQRAASRLDGVPQDAREAPLVVPERPSSSSEPESPGLFERLLERLQWSMTPPLARVAIGAQFALLLGLAVLVGLGDSGETTYETVAGPDATRADFTISFAAGATEADIRALLLDTNTVIVDGPSALGLYRLRSDSTADLDEMRERLTASPLTTFVQPAEPRR